MIFDGKVMFKVGQKNTSETEQPSFLVEDRLSIVDCPGTGDSNKKKEYANMASI